MLSGTALEEQLRGLLAEAPWRPLRDPDDPLKPTPQRLAYESEADVLLYGGKPGGGKTDLLLGLALTAHQHSIIFRRQSKEVLGLEQRAEQILGSRVGYNGQLHSWRLPGKEGRVLEFGHCQHPGDEAAYQGRPHDFIGFDEITAFLKGQFEFLKAWKRTVRDQRTRIVCAGNPPTTPEGEWVLSYWAPWVDPDHPDPAKPGELRWFVPGDADEDLEVDGPEPFIRGRRRLVPESRTFIPSEVTDNPYLMATGYQDTIDQLPTWLYDQLTSFERRGDDDPYQVIPTDWVVAAQERWREMGGVPGDARMTSLGVDPAQGGPDVFVMAPRYGRIYGELVCIPGQKVLSPREGTNLILTHMRHGAVISIDVDGPGGQIYGHMLESGVPICAMAGGKESNGTDTTGLIRFYNKRSEWIYRLREALDPDGPAPIALPPSRRLRADLCAPRRRDSGDNRLIRVESKKEIRKRIGRSPDEGDAVMYALAAGDELIENALTGPGGRHGDIAVERRYDPRRW